MPVSAGSHNDLYAKRRATRLLATALDPAFLRVKLTVMRSDALLAVLGGFIQCTSPGCKFAWLPEDDAMLRKLWIAHMHREDIARILNRTIDAVRVRVHTLDLPTRGKVRW